MSKRRKHNRKLTPEQKTYNWIRSNLEGFMDHTGEPHKGRMLRAFQDRFQFDLTKEFVYNTIDKATEEYYR